MRVLCCLQAKQLHENIKDEIGEVELVIVSPLTRAMQTALGGFEGGFVPLTRSCMGCCI